MLIKNNLVETKIFHTLKYGYCFVWQRAGAFPHAYVNYFFECLNCIHANRVSYLCFVTAIIASTTTTTTATFIDPDLLVAAAAASVDVEKRSSVDWYGTCAVRPRSTRQIRRSTAHTQHNTHNNVNNNNMLNMFFFYRPVRSTNVSGNHTKHMKKKYFKFWQQKYTKKNRIAHVGFGRFACSRDDAFVLQ